MFYFDFEKKPENKRPSGETKWGRKQPAEGRKKYRKRQYVENKPERIKSCRRERREKIPNAYFIIYA